MTRIIKTISLDEETNRIAKQLPNFSQFIRAKLLEYQGIESKSLFGYFWLCDPCNKIKNYYVSNNKFRRPKVQPICSHCAKDMTELSESEYNEMVN